MSEAMRLQAGRTPAWLLFSGVAIGVVGASVHKHAETVGELVRRGSARPNREFGRNSGWCPWPRGLAAAGCWRSGGASWAGSDCPRRPTQTTAPRNGSTLLSCLWLRDVGSLLVLKAEPAGRWRRSLGMATMRPTSGSPPSGAGFRLKSDKSTDSAVTAQQLVDRNTLRSAQTQLCVTSVACQLSSRGGSFDGTALDPRGPTRRPAGKCSLCSAGRFGLRRGRRRNDGRLSSPRAVGWRSGAGCVGRFVGSGWLHCPLDWALHRSPLAVSI